jgi:hypothetical protein
MPVGRGVNQLDLIAADLAAWIDDAAERVALAFAPARSPFSAQVTEQQKLDFYTRRLFNPDGSPNVTGRQAELERLGAEGFGKVYQAVVAAHPELKPAPEPETTNLFDQPPPMPPGPPGPPMPPMMPPGPPMGGPPMMPPGGMP